MTDVLLLDMSNIFIRSFCAIQYENERGVDLSGVVGTLATIQSQIIKHQPTHVVAVFDGKGGSKKKKKIWEGYKEGRSIPIKVNRFVRPEDMGKEREHSRENYMYQLKRLNEFISELPIHRVVIEGCEADEVIGYMSEVYYKDQSKIIVSGDKDFHQLISGRCTQYSLNDKKIVTPSTVYEKWGTKYGRNVLLFRCFDGDGSDNIPGLFGYGIKSLLKYFPHLADEKEIVDLTQFREYLIWLREKCEQEKATYVKNYNTVLQKIDQILDGVDKKQPEKCWTILERNYTLMQLFEPRLTSDAKDKMYKCMDERVKFSSIGYKKLVIEEDINISDTNLYLWETTYKDLEYKQKQAQKLILEADLQEA